LGPNLKIRQNAILENIVSNAYAKFDDDRLWSETALGLTTTTTTTTTKQRFLFRVLKRNYSVTVWIKKSPPWNFLTFISQTVGNF